MGLLFLPFRGFPQQPAVASVGDSSGAEQPAQTKPVEEPDESSNRC